MLQSSNQFSGKKELRVNLSQPERPQGELRPIRNIQLQDDGGVRRGVQEGIFAFIKAKTFR